MSTQIKFLTKNFGSYDPSSIGAYMNIGGFEALRKAVSEYLIARSVSASGPTTFSEPGKKPLAE